MCRQGKGFLGIKRIHHDWHVYRLKCYDLFGVGADWVSKHIVNIGLFLPGENLTAIRIAECGKVEVYVEGWIGDTFWHSTSITETDVEHIARTLKTELVPYTN